MNTSGYLLPCMSHSYLSRITERKKERGGENLHSMRCGDTMRRRRRRCHVRHIHTYIHICNAGKAGRLHLEFNTLHLGMAWCSIVCIPPPPSLYLSLFLDEHMEMLGNVLLLLLCALRELRCVALRCVAYRSPSMYNVKIPQFHGHHFWFEYWWWWWARREYRTYLSLWLCAPPTRDQTGPFFLPYVLSPWVLNPLTHSLVRSR